MTIEPHQGGTKVTNMLVQLKNLKPNPFRDFAVDPYDDDNIAALEKSIDELGFWSGGVVCRHGKNGDIEIGAGHHRIKAAMNVGRKTAEVFIGGYSDEQMIRVYATENATQRGNSSTAIAGSVASAIQFLARTLLMRSAPLGETTSRASKAASVKASMRVENDGPGIGATAILNFLSKFQAYPRTV